MDKGGSLEHKFGTILSLIATPTFRRDAKTAPEAFQLSGAAVQILFQHFL
jgi:hypothetical protein